MGGGGAMRAAAKVVGGINGFRTVSLPDTHIASVTRRVPRSVATSPTTEDGKSVALLSSQNSNSDASLTSVVPKPILFDDWEFADDDDELLYDSIHPAPRVVFGNLEVPSFEEAREATTDLKDALEKVHLTPYDAGSDKSSTVGEDSNLCLQNSGHSETKTCISVENAVGLPTYNAATQAFSLLKANSDVQNVVAALASDKNVWDAVMQNEKVMEFMKQQYTSPTPLPSYHDLQESTKTAEEVEDKESSGNRFMEFVEGIKDKVSKIEFIQDVVSKMEFIQDVKVRVAKMISDFSGFFSSIFGGPTEGNISVDGNGNATAANALGASFMGLAVLAIMVVVLKRG